MRPPGRRLAGAGFALVASFVSVLLAIAGIGAPPASAQVAVDDPGFSRQWGLTAIGAPSAWATAAGTGVTVAVVDSGIDGNHPDLAGRIVGVVDCVGHDEVPGGCVEDAALGQDEAGHGTHVAGIIGAATDNGQGVAGVAPLARILSLKVLTADGTGRETDVAQAVRWAADRGAAVINLSLGNEAQAILGPGDDFRSALDYAWSRGSIPVLVAGNDLLLPGSLVDVPAVIVAATTRADTRAAYSNGVGNVRWAIAAPGGEADTAGSCESPTPHGILSTYYQPEGDVSTYACVAGTSMAAPHVSGALAVLRSAGLGPQGAIDRLLATADDLGAAGRDNSFGSGRVNLARAVEGLSAAGAFPATPTAPPSTGAPATTAAPPTTAVVAPGTIAPPVVPDTTTETTAPPASETTGTSGPTEDAAPELPLPLVDDENLPAFPLSVAVLAVVALFAAHMMRFTTTTSWARRTPER